MTVVWSFPPKLRPISGRLKVVIFLARYIAIWRGLAMERERRVLLRITVTKAGPNVSG